MSRTTSHTAANPTSERQGHHQMTTKTETGTIVSVHAVTLGSVLDADALSGAMTVTVEDPTDFDSDNGGSLAVGGTVYQYASADDDTGVITLTGGGLAANASDGDRVDVWNTAQDGPAVEYRALVELPGAVDNADTMDVPIALPLVPLLPEGLRNPGEGEIVTLQQHDDEWVATTATAGTGPQIQRAQFPTTVTDWNSAVTPGEYLSLEGLSTNSPDDTISWAGTVIGRGVPGAFPNTGSAVVQVLHRVDAGAIFYTGDPVMWVRRVDGIGGWRPWRQLAGPVASAAWTDCTNSGTYTKDGGFPLQVRKDANGVVWIRGRMNRSSNFGVGAFANTMTLPSSTFAPAYDIRFPIASGNATDLGIARIDSGSTTIQISALTGTATAAFHIIGSWQT